MDASTNPSTNKQTLTVPHTLGELFPLTAQQTLVKANRCLFCHDAPCIQACPTGIDVPLFIKQLASNAPLAAADTVLQSNLLGYSCGTVCPTQQLCEGACVLNDRDEAPIEIGLLQQQAVAHALATHKHPQLKRLAPLVPYQTVLGHKRVAIIGGGPAGLSVAYELAQAGVDVTVYEQRSQLGGLNQFGISPDKLSVAQSEAEVQWLMQAGFNVRLNHQVTLDRDVELFDEGLTLQESAFRRCSLHELIHTHDAMLLAVGLGASHSLPHLHWSQQVQEAKPWIEEARLHPETKQLQGCNVVVVGGGNTALDAAIRSAQLGASVTVAYRRKLNQLSAYPQEVAKARRLGVQFVESALPISYDGVRSQLTVEIKQHHDVLMPLPADLVLLAVGQQTHPLTDALRWLGTHERAKVWVVGDAANGGKEVVNAVADAKHVVTQLLERWTQYTPNTPTSTGFVSSPLSLLHRSTVYADADAPSSLSSTVPVQG
ncbi:MAG: FAD-dependent oxidoreductase [Vampirovibrionales bacterium]